MRLSEVTFPQAVPVPGGTTSRYVKAEEVDAIELDGFIVTISKAGFAPTVVPLIGGHGKGERPLSAEELEAITARTAEMIRERKAEHDAKVNAVQADLNKLVDDLPKQLRKDRKREAKVRKMTLEQAKSADEERLWHDLHDAPGES